MKKITLAGMLAVSLFAGSAFAAQRVITTKVTGMTCGGCSDRITGELKKLPEVADAQVNFKTKLATVQVKEGASLTADQVNAAIVAAGYEAKTVKVTN